MVIGQLLGLPIAFGSGQLSGAGFGPNYTILMKLGYEFYAPRILDEMQKNPEKSFEETQYWRAFQKHLKSYTDKVLLQTIDSLAEFPKQTLDALQEKFGEFLSDSYSPSVSRDGVSTLTSASNLGSQLVTIRLDLGQGFRREDPATRQEGPSLFEKDEQAKREKEHVKILTKAEIDLVERNKIARKEEIRLFEKTVSTVKPSIEPPRTTIRPAGQSVKLERLKLIKEIQVLGSQISFANVDSRKYPQWKSKNDAANQLRTVAITKKQQKLTFLLQNYTF